MTLVRGDVLFLAMQQKENLLAMQQKENLLVIFPFFTYTITTKKRGEAKMDKKRIPIGFEDFK